ncbi:MAG: hypothetical protein M3O15_13665 [Acidobacteriota bacterium]|nr:hypothetical protein [Acidobacteriota bacterium]
MRLKNAFAATVALALAASLSASAAVQEPATSGSRITIVKVLAQKPTGGTIGTFGLKPGQPVPVKLKAPVKLSLVGIVVAKGSTTVVPLHATFTPAARKGSIQIIASDASSITLQVNHPSPHNLVQLSYQVTDTGLDIRPVLLKGRVTLKVK